MSDLREFEARLIAEIDPIATPSVAYGVARGDETLLLGASGLADKATGERATTRTPYSLASVTKPMTATAVMLLAERGLVDLDAPIDEDLGTTKLDGRAGDPHGATVRRVADHTAGLPLHYRFYYADEDDPRLPFEETGRRYAKLVTPPGERHQYSNLGYGLLDDLIRRVSGMPYARFMADEIFGPLGMTHSAIDAPPDAALAYGPDGVAYPRYDFDHPGGSAAFASLEDLLAFGRFHLDGSPRLLSTEARRAMQAPTFGYGLGWDVADRFGLRIVQHTGGMGGVRTILRLVPELDLVVAILVNGEGDLPFRAADDALAALDPAFREGLEFARATTPPVAANVPVPGEFEGVWSGTVSTWRDDLPFSLEILGGHKALVRLDGRESFVDGLRLANDRIIGVFDGDLGTEDAARRPYRLHLDLGRHDAALDGVVVAITEVNHLGGAPDRRLGNALASWTELSK